MKKATIFLVLQVCLSVIAHSQFHFYSNHQYTQSQEAIELMAGGFLIAAQEFDGDPDSTAWVHLVKTDAQGAVIWESNFANHFAVEGPEFRLFENEDGSFTVFTTVRLPSTCNGIPLDFVPAINILTVSSGGLLLSEHLLAEDCRLLLKDVVRLEGNTFAVLAKYEEVSNPLFEERLMIVDGSGVVSNQLVFPFEQFRVGALLNDGSDRFKLLYYKFSEGLKISTYDVALNILGEHLTTDIDDACFLAPSISIEHKVIRLSDGDWAIICSTPFLGENTHFFRLDTSWNVLSENRYSLFGFDLVETFDHNLILASVKNMADGNSDLKMVYLNETGDSLSAVVIPREGTFEGPKRIFRTFDDKLAIIGSAGCCIDDPVNGYSDSFLLIDDLLTSTKNRPSERPEILVYPNPANSAVTIRFDHFEPGGAFYLELYTAAGGRLFRKPLEHSMARLSVAHLPAGLYFYQIDSKAGIIKSGKMAKF